MTGIVHDTSTREVFAALLRHGIVLLPAPARHAPRGADEYSALPTSLDGVRALEIDLADRGYLLTAELYSALTALTPTQLAELGTDLIAAVDRELGGHVTHKPLFRMFPASTPTDTLALYLDRVLSLLLQYPDLPCVLCGADGTVSPVNPCGHLICSACFNGADYSACPICNRRIDENDPFLLPGDTEPATTRPLSRAPRRLTAALDPREAARTLLAGLLATGTDLGGNDNADLDALLPLALTGDDPTGWLPGTIAGRVTKARVLAAAVTAGCAGDELLATHLQTATDVLRLATALTGGDPALTGAGTRSTAAAGHHWGIDYVTGYTNPAQDAPARMSTLPRPIRRMLLAALSRLPFDDLMNDMLARAGQWKRIAQKLRPFEFTRDARYTRAGLAFAIVREVPLSTLTEPLRATLTACALATGSRHLTTRASVLGYRTWRARVEAALGAPHTAPIDLNVQVRDGDGDTDGQLTASADPSSAIALLSERPGELVRRLNQLLTLISGRPDAAKLTGQLLNTLTPALPQVAPAVLLSAYGTLRARTGPPARRLFFPAAATAKIHATADTRAPLPAEPVAAVTAVLRSELLTRAGTLPGADVAVIDRSLEQVIAPFAGRADATALVQVPRGSALELPGGDVLRLFVHWADPEGMRVDLDLGVALLDDHWNFLGRCDYTQLRFDHDAVVHSGDLTSGPLPLGATEFADLNLARLAEAGVRYVLPVVFSYNNVPFDMLERAFVGVMSHAELDGPLHDMRTVQQRLDLTGPSKVSLPMVLDLAGATMRWTELNLSVFGSGHNLYANAGALAEVARDVSEYFTGGARVSIAELACWHAAARTEQIVLRGSDGTGVLYRRAGSESVTEFADRATDNISAPDAVLGVEDIAALTEDATVFGALLVGDSLGAAAGHMYALYPGQLAGTAVQTISGTDLVAATPAAAAH